MLWQPLGRGPSTSDTSWYISPVTTPWLSPFSRLDVVGTLSLKHVPGSFGSYALPTSPWLWDTYQGSCTSPQQTRWPKYKDRVDLLIQDKGVQIISVAPDAFTSSQSL